MKEEFRWVVGYEGAYKISNFGRVLSVARIDCGGIREYRLSRIFNGISRGEYQ